MTQTEILQLLNLMRRFDAEELDCNGNCPRCYYYMAEGPLGLDECPLLVAYDMIDRRFRHCEKWEKKEQ